MFLDDDDLLRPETLAQAVRGAARASRGAGSDGRVPSLHGERRVVEGLSSATAARRHHLARAAVRLVGELRPESLPHGSHQRNWRIRSSPLQRAEDRKLWLEVATRGPVCVLPFVAMEYRQHARQISKDDGIPAQRQKIWAEFIAGLPAPAQREARGNQTRRRARPTVGRIARGSPFRAGLAVCNSAPALRRRGWCTSPVTRRPLWWGIKKCILRVRTA